MKTLTTKPKHTRAVEQAGKDAACLPDRRKVPLSQSGIDNSPVVTAQRVYLESILGAAQQAPVQRKISWENKGISDRLADDAKNMALVYISNTQTGKEIYEEVKKADEKVEIWMAGTGETHFATRDNIEMARKELPAFKKGFHGDMLIEWNVLDENAIPDEGAEHWSTAEGGSQTQSSVLGLLHELGHARQLINPEMRKQVAPWYEKQTEAVNAGNRDLQSLYNELVELHNLYHHEMQVADEMNEPIRTAYGGANPEAHKIEEARFKKTIKKFISLSRGRGYSGTQIASLLLDLKEKIRATEDEIELNEQLAALSEKLEALNTK